MRPLISVIIPSYNHAKFISKAVDSVLSQSYRNFEIIIADNYSDDDTDRVLSNYNNITVLKLRNEGVIAKSRNLAIKVAKGDWIAFLDSDDWWLDNKLEKCLAIATEGTMLIYHDMKVFDGDRNILTDQLVRSRKLNDPVLEDLLVDGNCLINSSVLVRRDLLNKVGGIDERRELVTAEDYHCWMKIAKETNGFLYIPEALGYYTVHKKGMSRKDVVAQTQLAVSDFEWILSNKQRDHAISFMRYFSMVNRQELQSRSASFKDALYCLKRGKILIKLKALVLMTKILLGKKN